MRFTALARIERLAVANPFGSVPLNAILAHDLGTLMGAIHGYVRLLDDGLCTAEEAKSIMRRLVKVTSHATSLVQAVAALENAAVGGRVLSLTRLEFPAVLEPVLFATQHLAEEAQTRVNLFRREADEAISIVSDARFIVQIFMNLATNGLKFGGGKPVNIRCQAGSFGGVCVSVSDSGVGIPSSDLERIYDPFQRLDGANRVPGTGLGLTIVKKLVELLGGTIRVTSNLGEGTTFVVNLPSISDIATSS